MSHPAPLPDKNRLPGMGRQPCYIESKQKCSESTEILKRIEDEKWGQRIKRDLYSRS